MKKFAFAVVLLLGMNGLFGQANSQLNFGIIGVSYDIPIATDWSIAPFARTDFQLNWLVAGGKVDYYFDNLIGLPPEWDLYGGANLGYAELLIDSWGTLDAFFWGLEVGGRYFWNDKWGVNLELSGGVATAYGIGITMKL
jgi:hypothetical protein